jgi:hypothetical protein
MNRGRSCQPNSGFDERNRSGRQCKETYYMAVPRLEMFSHHPSTIPYETSLAVPYYTGKSTFHKHIFKEVGLKSVVSVFPTSDTLWNPINILRYEIRNQ